MRILSVTMTATAVLALTSGMALATYHNKPSTTAQPSIKGDVKVQTGKAGGTLFLMDGEKMTLYVFDRDTSNVSNCTSGCASRWPPFVAPDGTSLPQGYRLITRSDGTKQVAYHSQPLYFWVRDKKPGDMKGDGVGGVWHVARP